MYSPTPQKVCTSSGESAFLSPQPFWCNAQTEKPFTYQEQAALRQDWNLALERSSQASTSAGPSPSLEDRSPLHSQPLSPACTRPLTPSFEDDGSSEVHTSPELGQRRPSFEKKAVQQTRKVFVGGVAQSIDQNSLYRMFGKVGKVKKAWLQMFHSDQSDGACNKHRGFGFVIFADEAAVEKLLDGEWSRVVYLDEGIRFEVKRAIGKVKDANVGHVKPVASQQSMPNQSLEPGLVALPSVPPFPAPSVPPFPAPQVLQWQPVAMVSPQTLLPSSTNSFDWLSSFLPSVLSEAFTEQRPRNKQDLAWILQEVMPDCYEE